MLGIAFSLTSLYTGAELASTLGLAVGVRAAIVVSVAGEEVADVVGHFNQVFAVHG